jgi:hypothetical protein
VSEQPFAHIGVRWELTIDREGQDLEGFQSLRTDLEEAIKTAIATTLSRYKGAEFVGSWEPETVGLSEN